MLALNLTVLLMGVIFVMVCIGIPVMYITDTIKMNKEEDEVLTGEQMYEMWFKSK